MSSEREREKSCARETRCGLESRSGLERIRKDAYAADDSETIMRMCMHFSPSVEALVGRPP